MATETTYIIIGGMTCSACTDSVENALKSVPGVVQVEVSLITEEAVINHTTQATPKQLEDAIDDIGFFPTLLNTESTIKKKPVPVRIEEPNLYKTTISVGGMTCSNCSNSITSTIKQIEGVEKVDVSLITEDAVIIHNDSIKTDDLKNAIEDCGFDAIIKKTEELTNKKTDEDITSVILRIGGMTCSNCSNTIETQVTKLPGIRTCYVALATEEARIEYDSNALGIRDIIECIEDCGFDATMINKLDYTTQLELLSKIREIQYWKTNLFKLLLAGIPIVLLGHVIPFFASIMNVNYHDIRLFHGTYLGISVQFVLGTYIQFVLAKKFYSNSFAALMHGSGTMDLLITVSTTIVYADSVFSMLIAFVGPGDYAPRVLFATSAMLFIFVSLGKWVESKAKGNTSTALSKLLSLTPTSCTIVENPEYFEFLKESGESIDPSKVIQKQISIDLLQKNDIAVILPGSKIPSDGVCVYGESEIDESLLTGESMPVPKAPGSRLIGGSLNSSSTVYMKIELLGARTQLQQIVQLVKDAQMTKAPVQRYADSIAAKFVPTILLLSFSTLVFWTLLLWVLDDKYIPKFFLDDTNEVEISKILQVAIAVIVVACPCALGLAAPTAVMVGTGVGASNGILIKGGEVLERASDIDCVIFDKTGTLTLGKMKLVGDNILRSKGVDDLTLWSILYVIESNSEHPAGIAIAKGALSKIEQSGKPILPLKLQEVKIHVGSGISAVILDESSGTTNTVKIGTSKFINEGKLHNNTEFQDILLDNESEVHSIASISHISINDAYVGYIELADTIRPDSKKAIQHLMSKGYIVAMVTGDNIRTANYVAKLAGIPSANVCSNSMPEDKIAYVERLQSKGLKVAFVGDGINDAPALVQSELGIAISSGTDIAIAAADIVLLSSSSDSNSTELNDEIELGITQTTGKPGIINVCSAFSISKQTFKTIKLNFLLAIVYNIVMLPIAMGCLIFPLGLTMHPMIASATMACSSVSVVLNSLRLKTWKPEVISDNNFLNGGVDTFNIDLENAENEGKTIDDFEVGKDQFQKNTGFLGKILSKIRWNRPQALKKGKYQRL